MAKAPFIKDLEKGIIAKYYEKYPNALAKEILVLVNRDPAMKGRTISLSTVQSELKKLRDKNEEEQNHLDLPWNIGLGMAKNIPADIVRELIPIKMLHDLTIREAKWISYLYPTLSPLLKASHSNDSSFNELGRIEVIAKLYGYQERINKMINENEFDTSALDDRYFIKRDVSDISIAEGWVAIVLPEIANALGENEIACSNQPKIEYEYESIIRKLNKEDKNLLSEYIENRLHVPEQRRKWEDENQNKITKIRELFSNMNPETKKALFQYYRTMFLESFREWYSVQII